jgi:O-antigen/teichoic acid export membrane protein
MVVSLLAAAIQMALLLLTARVLGAADYGLFSLIVAVAVFLAALAGEWLRMILARHGGSLRLRVRGSLLHAIRTWSVRLAGALLVAAIVAAAATDALYGPAAALWVLAGGACAAGNLLTDLTSTFLRFTSTQRAYSRFALIRSGVVGGASLLAALLGASGPAAALVFGGAGIVCGGGGMVAFWSRAGASRGGLLRRMAPVGWSLATGSISTNIALTLSRLGLTAALPEAAVGGVFLAIDLAVRGTNVLGAAISTWGSKLVFSGSHRDADRGARTEFTGVSAVFLTIWFSVAALGVVTCFAIPLIMLGIDADAGYLAATVTSLAAIYVLALRNFLFDPYLSALNRQREIALAASLTAVLAIVGALLAFLIRTPLAGIAALPVAVGVSTVVYAVRNARVIWDGLDRRAVFFAVQMLAALTVIAALAVFGAPAALIGGGGLVVAALGAWQIWAVYRALMAKAALPSTLDSPAAAALGNTAS